MKTFEFSPNDSIQIRKNDLSEAVVKKQLDTFYNGIPFIHLTAPATLGNGIFKFNDSEGEAFINTYASSDKDVLKFIPASGAASRMFKTLQQFISAFNSDSSPLDTLLDTPKFKSLKPFFDQLEKLPFYDSVRATIKTNHPGYSPKSRDEEKYDFVQCLLYEMDYPALPKGLIPFHHYEGKTATAFEEHLYEALTYGYKNGKARLHFTVAKEDAGLFQSIEKQITTQPEYLNSKFEITYSFQKKSTDTIAVDEQNRPFRDKEGKLVFRPGGHGALIQNLNDIDADIVFIKNIDNVVTHKNLPVVATYKKILAGLLITVQRKIFTLLEQLDHQGFTEKLQKEAQAIAEEYFDLATSFSSSKSIKSFFNKPIRVCGMVKNEGEPGGGPFWVNQMRNTPSLQIVEGAQIDKSNPDQVEILEKSTHFNPVDLVCGIKNYQGKKFDLLQYVNPDHAFITHKTKNGKPIKALELPGLWNGAMAYWNTIFVEVPLKTFNPVKTVTDLLKPGHQV